MRTPSLLRISPRAALTPLLLLSLVSVALAQGPPAAVRVDKVREEVVTDYLSVTGSLRAAQRVEVATREKGIVVSIYAREGETVKKGQAIAQLDSSQLELELDIVRAERGPLEASVEERKSDLDQFKRNLSALEVLAERKAASPKEVDDARSTLAAAEARLDLSTAQLLVLAARATKLEKRIANMRVLAPFDGTVVRRFTEEGAWLSQGATVVEIVSPHKLDVWLQVPQDLFSALSSFIGPIQIHVASLEQPFVLQSYTAVPDVQMKGRSFSLVGRVDRSDLLAPGMSVIASVPTAAKTKRMTIHRDAIMRNAVGSFVYAVIPGEEGQPASADPMDVRVLFQTEDRAVIESRSLRAGMEIVIEGNERLFPMAPIAPRRTGEQH